MQLVPDPEGHIFQKTTQLLPQPAELLSNLGGNINQKQQVNAQHKECLWSCESFPNHHDGEGQEG